MWRQYKIEISVIGIMVILIGLLTWVFIWANAHDKTAYKACKDIGGHMDVVGKRYSPATKTIVSIHGCVK